MSSSAARLTRGPVRGHLVSLTVPMIWGILAMMAFNVTDTWFVARLGAPQLAAMSFTFPVVMLLVSLGIGLMAGTSSVLARAIGGDAPGRAQRLTSDALLLGLLISVLVSAAGLLTLEPLFRLLGAEPDLLPLVRDYMTTWYAGFVFFLVPMVGMGAIRATGDSRLQSRMMIGAAALNLVLDPLLIYGLLGFPRLELQGAALATVLARASTLVVGYWAIRVRTRLLTFVPPTGAELRDSWRSVLHVGLPAAGTNVIIPLANGVAVALIARFGAEAVAGFGVATRIEALTLVVFFAMSAIIGPFVGQNLGAGRVERIAEAMRISALFCLGLGLLIAALLWLGAAPLTRLFNEDAEVVAVSRGYLHIVPLSYGCAGIVMVVNASFNGMGRPLPAVAISLARMGLLYLPAAWAGARLFGVHGVFAAYCLANLLSGAGAFLWSRRACLRELAARAPA